MTKARCLAELCSQVPTKADSSSLERSLPSTHRHTRLVLGGGQLGPDGLALLLQGGVDLRLGGVLGQLLLRQLHQGEPAVGGQALDVFGTGLLIELLLQLADAEDGHLLHSATSAP
mgnify:CR=1 FL=1